MSNNEQEISNEAADKSAEFEDDFEESPPTSPAAKPEAEAEAAAPETPAAAAAPAAAEAAEPTGGEKPPPNAVKTSFRPAVELDVPEAGGGLNDSLDNAIEEKIGGPDSPQGRGSPAGGKSPTGGGPDDLKARTMFSQSTVDGVLKRTTFISSLSTYPTAPQCTIASKGESMFQRSGQGPAPGSYNLPHEEKSRFRTSARFSFGGSSRFGLGGSPTKLQPGPGQYNPKDPALSVDTKVGFGTSVRNKGAGSSQQAPGPGAYENRSTVGGGLMFTACGRHPTSYMRSRSLPGPGTYAPTLNGAYQASPKCGFGTSTRAEFGAGSRGQPGPGTYEMQNFKCLGKDSKKFSATSRRRVHDLSSYVTPGPGTYNAHATSFGAPGAASCSQVDEGYKMRNSPSAP